MSTAETLHKRSWYSDILLLTFGIVFIFTLFLSSRPLSTPDEARYSEIPREMVVSGDYTTPHLNNIKYFEKPVLFYWMQSASIHLFGLSEWAMRLPNMLMALLGCLFTYATGRILFNRASGIIGSIILATNLLYFAMAHIVTLDMTVTVWLTLSLFSFLIGTQTTQPLSRRLLLYAFYVCAALAVLTKGLIGIIFPGMIIGAWIVLLNEWRLLKIVYLPTGIILFLVIAVPWHIFVQLKNPEFLYFYFIDQHFIRYLTMEAGRYKPFWFWLPIVILGFLPWTVFLPQAIYQHFPKNWITRFHYKKELFLLLWAGLIFIFFTLSNSKLIPYILPIFPPLALLISHYLVTQWYNYSHSKSYKISSIMIPVSVGLLIAAGIIALQLPSTKYSPIDFLQTKNLLLLITLIWLPGTFAGAVLLLRKINKIGFGLIAISSALVFMLLVKNIPLFDNRSVKTLALILKPLLTKNAEVVAYEHYYQDLPFYLERRVSVVEWRNELAFGIQHQPEAKQWMIDHATFWQHWRSNQPVYMLTDQNTYHSLQQNKEDKLYLLAQTPLAVLLANHKPSFP